MNRAAHLQAWRWLFILEGLPSVILSVFVFFFYPDYPEISRWLSADERELAARRIKGVSALGHAKITWKEAKETLLDWRLYIHHLLFMCISVPFSSISLFAPTIVTGLGYEGTRATLMACPPYGLGFIVVLASGWTADRYGHLFVHYVVGVVVTMVALIVLMAVESLVVRYVMFFLIMFMCASSLLESCPCNC